MEVNAERLDAVVALLTALAKRTTPNVSLDIDTLGSAGRTYSHTEYLAAIYEGERMGESELARKLLRILEK